MRLVRYASDLNWNSGYWPLTCVVNGESWERKKIETRDGDVAVVIYYLSTVPKDKDFPYTELHVLND